MDALFEPARPGIAAATCAVLLPPAYARPADFLAAGFASAVRARALEIDLVLPQLEIRQVTERSAVPQLHALLASVRARGCRSVWIGGISLGGLVALACAERHREAVDGVVVFAPYLGSHLVTGEIVRAGGLGAWQPGEPVTDDDERRIWRFLQRGAGGLPVRLGFGAQDRFAHSHRLLAQALAPACVDIIPGGHDWPTWARLWENFLATGSATSSRGANEDSNASASS